MRAWSVAMMVAVAGPACGPSVGGERDASGGEEGGGGGEHGTGALEYASSGDIPVDDPFDCVEAIVSGNNNVFAEAIDDADACLVCAAVGLCGYDSDCAAGAYCDYDFAVPGPGFCIRECSDDDECSDGRTCLEVPTQHGVRVNLCGQRSADAYACAALGVGDPCRDIADQASCEAIASPEFGVRCQWAEEILLAAPATCEPLSTTGFCLAVAEFDDDHPCQPGQSCDAEGRMVQWRDYGAGTVGVIATDPGWRIYREPTDSGGIHVQQCDFSGAVALPYACSCA